MNTMPLYLPVHHMSKQYSMMVNVDTLVQVPDLTCPVNYCM